MHKFVICLGGAPSCLDLISIVIKGIFVECVEIHVFHSFPLYFTGEENQLLDVLGLQLQELDLLFQCFLGIKGWIVQHGFDLFQGKAKLTKHEDVL